MNIFERYEKEFNELVDISYCVIRHRIYPKNHYLADRIVKAILQIKHPKKLFIDKDDLRQDIALMWLEYFKKYKNTEHKHGLKNYIIKMSIWKLRDMIKKELRGPRKVSMPELKHATKFKDHILDFHWLLHGDKEDSPLYMLGAYERYLIFLYYVCDLSIEDISKRVYKCPQVVSKSIKQLVNKIRSYR